MQKKRINNKQQTLVRYAETMRNALLFIERGLTQTDLYELIKSNGSEIGKDRINRIVNGKLTNFHTNTAKILSNALGVKIDDIVE